jgi:DNA polymerase III subunit delta
VKLEARRVASFLRDPGRTRVILLYGEDTGLIRERAAALVRAVIGAADDPFRVVTLARAEDLPGEAAGVSLGGGRRVVRLPEAGDSAREAVAAALAGPGDALVLLEAAGLSPSRSRLLKLIEASAEAAAIACYPEEGERLAEAARGWLAERDVQIDAEALTWLASQLGADRALSRAEVEKLALFVGPGGRAGLAAAEACVGDVAGLSLDDALFAATAGDVATADRALERALAEGVTPVGVIRAGLMHLERLQQASLAVSAGASSAAAMRQVRPPVFYRRQSAFVRALDLWPPPALVAALDAFFQGERDAKRTGVPAATLCRHLVLTLARRTANRA